MGGDIGRPSRRNGLHTLASSLPAHAQPSFSGPRGDTRLEKDPGTFRKSWKEKPGLAGAGSTSSGEAQVSSGATVLMGTKQTQSHVKNQRAGPGEEAKDTSFTEDAPRWLCGHPSGRRSGLGRRPWTCEQGRVSPLILISSRWCHISVLWGKGGHLLYFIYLQGSAVGGGREGVQRLEKKQRKRARGGGERVRGPPAARPMPPALGTGPLPRELAVLRGCLWLPAPLVRGLTWSSDPRCQVFAEPQWNQLCQAPGPKTTKTRFQAPWAPCLVRESAREWGREGQCGRRWGL